jgi:hypothetical protein
MRQKEYILDGQKLLKANLDFRREIEREDVCLSYSAELDSLFIQFGQPLEALSEHVADNLMLRIEPDTLKIVGIEVLDFMNDFLPNNRIFQEIAGRMGIKAGQDFEADLTGTEFGFFREILGSVVPGLAQTLARNVR